MTRMWNECIFICFLYAIWFFTRPSILGILALTLEFLNTNHFMIVIRNVYFWKIYNIHIHTWPCIVLILFCWGDNSERNVESLMMILFSTYLASLSPPSYRSLTSLLWRYITYTCSYNIGTILVLVWPSMFTFILSLTMGDCTTCGWLIIKL